MIKGLPDRLKKLRVQHKYSQRGVADKLKVSPAIISAYETGERTPSTENILALSRLYRCSTDYLLGNKLYSEAVLSINGLSDEQLQALQLIIDSMR